MDRKEFANKVLKNATTPLFTTADVSDMTGAKPVTIRAWINRGYLKLQFAARPGSGKQMLFAPIDAIEVMAFSQVSSLNMPPSKFSGRVAKNFTANIWTQFNLIAENETYEADSKEVFYAYCDKLNKENPKEPPLHMEWPGFHRYSILIPPAPWWDTKEHVTMIESDDCAELENPFGSISVVADCKDFAEKALSIFMNFEARFPTS